MQAVAAEKITEADITLYKNDTVVLHNLRTFEGKLPQTQKEKSEYNVTITGKNNQILQSIQIYPIFILADAPNPKREAIPMTIQIPYYSIGKEFQINHGKLIFSQNIENYFCNSDSYCGINENYISCPSDCPSGSVDGWCDKVEDNKCDADCLSNIDSDCKSPRKNILIIIIIILFAALIAIVLWRKRHKREPPLYYEAQVQ